MGANGQYLQQKKLRIIIMKYLLYPLIGLLLLMSGTVQCPARQTAASSDDSRSNSIRSSLATSVAAALFGLKEKKLVLVDVRLSRDFEKCHIPGSLNIPIYALKTKTFLKAKPVVLVNEGFHVTPLARACTDLNQSGFSATILAGGLAAWEDAGADLAGDPFARAALRQITPQDLYLERDNPHVSIVADSDGGKAYGGFGPNLQRLSGLEKQETATAMKKNKGSSSSDPFACLVVVTAMGGSRHAMIQRNFASAGLHKVFFLEGGAKAYAAYLDDLLLTRQPKQQRILRNNGCPTCAAAQ